MTTQNEPSYLLRAEEYKQKCASLRDSYLERGDAQMVVVFAALLEGAEVIYDMALKLWIEAQR